MLKQEALIATIEHAYQPPLGGCVLKPPLILRSIKFIVEQPPLGGCVLKLPMLQVQLRYHSQPPLGGCVLKPLC